MGEVGRTEGDDCGGEGRGNVRGSNEGGIIEKGVREERRRSVTEVDMEGINGLFFHPYPLSTPPP